MSIFRMPTLNNISTRFQSLRDHIGRGARLDSKHQKMRHLALDPLEERQLLSVTPADFMDTLVNQTVSEDEILFATHGRYGSNWDTPQSMAMDDDGDFVVTWTRYDNFVDPTTGQTVRNANVYARYFTDEVQRISVPDELVENNVDGEYGFFTIKYGGNEVQKITISATHEPLTGSQKNILGNIELGFDVNGNGSIDPGTEITTIFYDERHDTLAETAEQIQTALQGLGGALADVTVNPVSPTEYEVHFGDFSLAEDQPLITVEGTSFTSGFLPAVQVETLREPVVLGPIYVSPDNPELTATSIEEVFRLEVRSYDIGPTEFPPTSRIVSELGNLGPYYYPDQTAQGNPNVPNPVDHAYVPGVNVKPIEEYISFIPDTDDVDGDGDKEEPLPDAFGNPILDTEDLDADGDTFEYLPWFDENVQVRNNYPDTFDADGDGDKDEPLPDAAGNPIRDIHDLDNDGDTDELRPWLSQFGEWQMSLTDFEVTFDGAMGSVEGAAGKKDHPELVFVSATTDNGFLIDGNDLDEKTIVRTIKEPSPEFRVNPEEPESTFTPLPDKYDQKDSVVAMDADGNFIIVWESEVPDFMNAGSVSDIYARQFSPVGNDVEGALEFVPGVMAMGEVFRVNTSTPGMQGDPSVGMDDAGNFTIAWGSGGQDLSYFNSVRARTFDRDYGPSGTGSGDDFVGEGAGDEFLVNQENTTIHFNPYVAVSPAGDILIAWTNTDDEQYVTNSGLASSLLATVFDSDGNVIMPQFPPGGWNGATAAFDKTDNASFIIAWDTPGENQNPPGNVNIGGTQARMWRLYDGNGNLNPQQIRSTFAVNSADFDPTRTSLWPNIQEYVNPALDADGDVTVAYNGFGPDVSDDEYLYSVYYQEANSDPANADLLQFLPYNSFDLTYLYQETYRYDPVLDVTESYYTLKNPSDVDVDTAIEFVMIRAANAGATSEQLGRIRAVLDSKAQLLRGEANGVMYSQFDADPTIAPSNNILYSDNVANAQRDGHNQKYIIAVDTDTTGGSFELRLSSAHSPTSYEDLTINGFHQNSRLRTDWLRDELEEELRNAARTGVNWPYNTYEGPVEVRLVSGGFGWVSQELVERTYSVPGVGSPWAYPWSLQTLANTAVYEITFQGEVHDAWVSLSTRNNQLQPDTERTLLLAEYQEADSGIMQQQPTIEMEPDGDFTMIWQQQEEYTYQSDGGSPNTEYFANTNIYYRRFDESTDTAGPRVTDLIDHNGNRVDSGATIDGAVRHLVVTFDEALMTDPDNYEHSVLNPNNWVLSQDGISIVGAVRNVEFGLNKASELVGTYDGVGDGDDGFGERYDLSQIPSNKWEAVLTLDANGIINEFEPRLGIGEFEITALSSIHDVMGNPLEANGPIPSGRNVTKVFQVSVNLDDIPIDPPTSTSSRTSGTLHPETPNAVAVDADGDHVVVWTAYDSTAGHDRVYWRLFDADGSPADIPLVDANGGLIPHPLTGDPQYFEAPVMPVTDNNDSDFEEDDQRHGSVAIDPDGDFIITWTNYRDGDANIFARSFPARAILMAHLDADVDPDPFLTEGVSDPFQVNDYTQDNQKWSDVALDREGNYVITWTSYAQELNGELGSGYGIYARQYDSEDRALAPEFQINVTTAGDQQTPSIAMAADGTFVIAWTSDQNGTDDDIIVREFNADGSAKAGPLQGERLVNDITAGHQRNPDVAMRFDSESYVVTWMDTAADISGTSVWAELSSPQPQRYLDPIPHLIHATHNFTITVPARSNGAPFTIADVNVQLGDLSHGRLEDLEVLLTHGNVTVRLFDSLPRPYLVSGNRPAGNSMYGTIFDDEAPTSIRITDSDAGAVPPYDGTFVPQQVLAAFDGLDAVGTWTLTVIDRLPGNGLVGTLYPISESIGSWNLDITEDTQDDPDSFIVNSTTIGQQMYPSVAMDTYGNFTVTWSGQGESNQDTSGHGVYYQRYDRGGTRVGRQTLVNLDTNGDQWISSVGMDARGNFVIAWTGEGAIPGTNAIFKYDSIRNFPRTDNDGPIVTDVYQGTQRIFNGGVITAVPGGITEITVVFNENLSVLEGEAGLNSVLNPNNWVIVKNDNEIVGGILGVEFGMNPLTNKYEATVTFDGNGLNFNEPGLEEGDYVLTVRDLITDTSRFVDPDDVGTITPGNYLDGDFDGVPGSRPITIGLGGYEHKFSIAAAAQVGPEFRINEAATVPYEQRISAPGGLGQAREESNRSVAVDNDGDFAVVWTTYGLDDPLDPNSGGVYVRLYDREDNPLTPEFQVNQNVAGHQRNASIAMDSDGDFVIVWESEGTSLDGSWDIFARRFDSMGRPQGNEFLVNSTVTANQLNPTIAMDDRGAFVIAWATAGQDFSFFNDVYAQRYDRFGEAQGVEFLVNSNALSVGPGGISPSQFEINPSAAMSGATGDFVIAWEVVTAQTDGVITNTVIAGRSFDATGVALTDDTRLDVNVGTGNASGGLDQYRVARNPQMVMNDQGEVYLVWESYVTKTPEKPNDYDVFYAQYNADDLTLTPQGADHVLQLDPALFPDEYPLFVGHQVNPSIGVDADGDFAVVWNGPGATVDPLYPGNVDQFVDYDDAGVFMRRFNAGDQTIATQERVNRTEYGAQYQPTIGMEPDGDAIVVWSGVGVGDNHGIFARRYNETTDTAGPTVSDWADERGLSLDNGHIFEGAGNEVQYLVLTFDEDMLQSGDDRVTNPANYELLRGGIKVPGAIVRVEYGLNKASELSGAIDPLTGQPYQFSSNATNKYEAILTFDGDPTSSGLQPLEDASYQITALAAATGVRSGLRDVVGNALYRTGYAPNGDNFVASFVVQIEEPPPPPQPDPPEETDVQTGPVDWDAILVNQVYSEDQFTSAGQSLAVDNDGDFVVAWTRYDAVDNTGAPTDANIYARYFTDEVQRLSLPTQMAEDTDNDPDTLGTFTLEYNAPEIQILSVTAGIQPFTSDNLDDANDEDEVGTVKGSFVLGYDLTGDGTIGDDPGVNETVTVGNFDEETMEDNALAIQNALRSLGGELTGVTVRAINPRDFMIEFAEATAGLDISEITVESLQLVDAYLPAVTVTTQREGLVFNGIYVSQDDPMLTALSIENAISGMNNSYGALGPVDFPPPDRVTNNSEEAPYTAPWWSSTNALEVDVIPVITPDGTMSLTDFDITFIDSSGKQNHPQLSITNARNDENQTISIPADAVTTRKEPSNEFRVNPEEPDNPNTAGTDAYNQTDPAVAMDADGDFIIVWEGEIPNTQDFGSVSDVFGRRFTPFGKTDDAVPGEVIDIFGGSTGIRELINPEAEDVQRLTFDADNIYDPLVGTFRLQLGNVITESIQFNSEDLRATADDIEFQLAEAGIEGVTVVQVPTANTGRYRLELRFGGDSAGIDHPTIQYLNDGPALEATVSAEDVADDFITIHLNQDTANPQFDPAVAMDESGAFVVTWANGGQTLSFFNHISVQRFNRFGERLGNEFQVNAETTSIQFAPSVALSNSGNFLITWSRTDDIEFTLNQPYQADVRAKLFDPTGTQIVGEFTAGAGGASMAAFDADDNYVITWQGAFDTLAGVIDSGIHARQFALYDDAGQPNNTPVETRAEFRINSSAASTSDPLLWPYNQFNAQPAIDADGDLSVIYEGYGPDVSVNVSMAAGYFAELMNKPANQDLWVYFDPFDVYERGQEGVPVTMLTEIMGNNGDVDGSIEQVLFRATELGASDEQLGRLRAIMEQTVGQLRGEANGILVSQWDADPTLNAQLDPLYSDNVVNSYRDGQNQRSYIEIPMVFDLGMSTWLQAESGYFTIQVTNLLTGELEQADVDIADNGWTNPLSIEGTRQNLENALENMALLGSAWSNEEGVVDIREVEPDEVFSRTATDWEIDEIDETLYEERSGGLRGNQGYRNVLYEIVFQGAAHDIPFEIEIIASHTLRGGLVVTANGDLVIGWVDGPPVGPAFYGETYGLEGTLQTLPSIGMEPDGDYTALYTQVESYRNAGFTTSETSIANRNIYYRRFDEITDTAGPRVTDWADGTGTPLEDNAVLQKHLQYVVLTFDEEMLSGDPAEVADSILNTENFKLFESNAEIDGGVVNVAFGLSKAAELANQTDPLTGQVYGLDPVPSNKWEAVVTFDGNADQDGAQPLRDGFYSFQALASVEGSSTVAGHSGLRDRVGNTLYHTGFDPAGEDFQRSFNIKVTERKDEPVNDPAVEIPQKNAHTHPESPGAIAADADGDYVVVWTAFDTATNRDKIYYRLFDADGTYADLPIVDRQTGEPVFDVTADPVENIYPVCELTPDGLTRLTADGDEVGFQNDIQRFATVAMDKDGDFVVTWTNYDYDPIAATYNANVYARRLDSMGEMAGVVASGTAYETISKGGEGNPSAVSNPFRINTYTDDSQKWSNVAMDVDGDFIVTWSSYGQEDNGQLGKGYGVYARRYDSFGQPLAREFQVNVTEGGNQQFSNVAMDSQGGFTIAWTSSQNGISDDIIVRDFNADGSPVGGPLGGEIIANQVQEGDQRYPDIAMNLSGDQYVVTWSASGQDGSGWGVYGRLFNRSDTTLYVPTSPALAIPDTGTEEDTLNVSSNAIITDLNVRLELQHASPADLEVHLISPNGTDVELFANVPGTLNNGNLPQGSNFSGTLLDDEASVAINNPDGGAVPPFAGTFRPTGTLADFDGENVNGQWRLRITDSNGNDRSGLLEQWSLIVERSAVAGQEFRVNTTSVGNQTYSSVAMDHQGEFVVTWSGFGNQPEHADLDGTGVFLQRFEATGDRIGDESRVNMTTEGNQAIPSVSSDGVGNYYIAYTGVKRDSTGVNDPNGETEVYVLASNSTLILQDNDPPIVTDIQLSDRTRLLQDDVIAPSTDSLHVQFGEALSLTGTSSVENLDNWELTRNGNQISNAIQSVDFRYNAATRKHEAVLNLSQSILPLDPGEYQLTAGSVISDNINSLDGDLDGIPGSNPATTTQPGYQFHFNVSNSSNVSIGTEHRVNEATYYEDRFSAAYGTGTARETSSTTLAVDHDGNYVVVWTRYGADNPDDPAGAGIYMRLYDHEDNPIGGEVQVNTYTEGDQRNPAVAMDADGDFIVVWESIDGGSGNFNADNTYDIYARRFSAAGTAREFNEYRVNSELTGHQVNPAVAVDDSGNFAIVWATAGQDFSFYNDVKGQMFRAVPFIHPDDTPNEIHAKYLNPSFDDLRAGTEFLVNSFDVPGVGAIGTSGFEINPAVAMGGVTGNMVVAWEVVTAQQDGAVTDTEIAARIFTRSIDGTAGPTAPEFVAHSGGGTGGADTERVARNPQLAVDDQDGFIIVWESYTGTDYDVFYQEFDSAGNALTDAQVNMTQFTGQQVNPSVGIDADGDFTIVYNGNGGEPDPLDPNNTALYTTEDLEGIWIRSYDAANQSVNVQSRVNTVAGGIQQFPTIGMEPDGDVTVAWSGRGIGDQHGIFVRRYNEPTDTAGPRVTELRLANGTLLDTEITNVPYPGNPQELVVVFDENLWNVAGDPDRVTNPENWRLERDGNNISSQITNIGFELGASGKWEATLTFQASLQAGLYTLEVYPPEPDVPGTVEIEGQSGIRDAVGNPLGQDGLNPGGQTYSMQFRLGTGSTGTTGRSATLPASAAPAVTDAETRFETPNAVAVDDDGDYVVVLTAKDDTSGSPTFGKDRVYYRLYHADGTAKGLLKAVSTDRPTDDQRLPSVAVDADGDFVVTWTSYNENGDTDIYARRFTTAGEPMDWPDGSDGAVRVNTFGAFGSSRETAQIWSDVAMDIDGDFVITWSSQGQEEGEDGAPASDYGVYARRYDSLGHVLGAEFRVNWANVGNQRFPSVAMDAQGGFYIVWASDGNGEGEDIVGRAYYADGSPIPIIQSIFPEQPINQSLEGDQLYPDVAINRAGDRVVVTWSSNTPTSDGWDVFATAFDVFQDPLATAAQVPQTFQSEDPLLPIVIPDGIRSGITSTCEVDQNFIIDDINVQLTIVHPDPRDLIINLVSPSGTRIELASRVPTPTSDLATQSWRSEDPDDPLYLPVDGNGFLGTTFDDEAGNVIDNPDGDPRGIVPFSDLYVPEDRLRAFDGEPSGGTWRLEVIDTRTAIGDLEDYPWVQRGEGELESWSLTITPRLGAPEFQVNETTDGNQLYSSVATDAAGDFVIAWSGRGDREFEQDPEGVFYRRYNAGTTPIGNETSVTPRDDVRQWMPSIGSDAQGNFVIGYTTDDNTSTNVNGNIINTDVHVFRSQEHLTTIDDASPVITNVLLPSGKILRNETSVRESDLAGNQLTILFSEDMALLGPATDDYPAGAPHPGSVENLANWSLSRNGTDLPVAISNIAFSYNSVLQKYQAVLTLDGGTDWSLGEGEFVLTAQPTIHDAYLDPDIDPDVDPDADIFFGANALNGNFDVGAQAAPGSSGDRPYTIKFNVIDASIPSGTEEALLGLNGEYNVTSDFSDTYVDRIAQPLGTGQGQESGANAAAIDDDGDLAVVWTRYFNSDQNPSDVYLRLVDTDNNASAPIRVNEGVNPDGGRFEDGIQRNATVAMDADGDIIVVWESLPVTTSPLPDIDIYARRYDAAGNALCAPFLVNTESGYVATGSQERPAVAMDDYGNSIIVWASRTGDEYSYFTDIYAKRYDMLGRPVGTEFQINEVTLPGTSSWPQAVGSAEIKPAVALHESGTFVVAWEQIDSQQNGYERDTILVARGFDANSNPETAEFRVDSAGAGFLSDLYHTPQTAPAGGTDVARSARNAKIAMDSQGNYIIVWESYHDNDINITGQADSYGIYFHEFFADHTSARTIDHQANLVITTDNQNTVDPGINADHFALNQVNPSIGVDADGDFAIVWNGNGATADPFDPTQQSRIRDMDLDGVFVREFHAGIFDPNTPVLDGEAVYVSPQSRVNQTGGGVQQFPTIVMQPDGDFVVVWSGAGVGEQQGLYYRRYFTDGDTAGPLATELRTMGDQLVPEGDEIFVNPTQLKVIFNEQMNGATTDMVNDPNGVATGDKAGYNSVENINNWTLIDGRGSEMVNAIQSVDCSFNTTTNKWEAVVTFNDPTYTNGELANGYYTLVARTQMHDMSGNPLAQTGLRPEGTGMNFQPPTSPLGGIGLSFRVHQLSPGTPTVHDLDPVVNTNLIGSKANPAIARNANGRYVAVWTEEIGQESALDPTVIITSTEIYARIFQANVAGIDEPVINRFGSTDAFLVNSLTSDDQFTPDVAIDDAGNFVIVWAGRGVSALGEQDDNGIFGQRYNSIGDPIEGQFGVNQTSDGIQSDPAVAMNAATGDFVVTWTSHEQGGIMARTFAASGGSTNEFLVNTTTGNHHETPDVAMDTDGDFTVTWAADQQDAGSFGVFAQRLNTDGTSFTKVGGEFQVNQFETNQQESPRIAMDANGAFVIAWQSFGQDAFGGYGIYARLYDNNGNTVRGEFQVNQETASYQFEPAVAMASDPDKGFVVTWSSFEQEGDRGELYGIFARMYDSTGNDYLDGGTALGEFRINAIVEGDQRHSDVAMDNDGHYIVVWQGDNTVFTQLDPTDPTSEIIQFDQTDIYARFVDPPVSLSSDGKTLDLSGTPAQDTFEFVAGATPGSWVIKINGEAYTAASTVETINFDGMGGDDIITLTGTDGVETVTLRPGEVTFVGSNFTFNATDVEDVTVNGRGGKDTAEIRGSSGDDALVMQVDKTTMTGSGFTTMVVKFEEVHAYSEGGIDEAKLYDTDGNEVFTSTPEYVRMEGSGFMHRAKGFRYAHGYSSGGDDIAKMHDSAGNDKFKHYSGQSKMFGGGFYVRAKNFPEVDAYADAGGKDYARIFDTSSVDKFTGTPEMARMYSTDADYDVTAAMFEKVLAYAGKGGNDIARFYTSDTGKQVFSGHKGKAVFYDDNFEILARKFEKVQAHDEAGGNDIAKLRDTEGDNHLVVDDTSAKMYEMVGDDMELLYEVFAFDHLKTYRSSGNDTKDVANTVDNLLLDDGWVDD